MGKPVVPDISIRKPVVGAVVANSDWLFSFKDFGQMEYFGVNGVGEKWFVSLIERLRDLSKINKVELEKDIYLKENIRYHVVDWDAYKIPIQRKDIDWVKKDIIENEVEFPFYQFHVAKSLGRIVGYWQENVFHIVLLDPMHNLQPSKKYDYRVTDTTKASSDLTSFLSQIEDIKAINCKDADCGVKAAVNNINYAKEGSNAVVCFLSPDFLEQLNVITKVHCISKVLETGILHII